MPQNAPVSTASNQISLPEWMLDLRGQLAYCRNAGCCEVSSRSCTGSVRNITPTWRSQTAGAGGGPCSPALSGRIPDSQLATTHDSLGRTASGCRLVRPMASTASSEVRDASAAARRAARAAGMPAGPIAGSQKSSRCSGIAGGDLAGCKILMNNGVVASNRAKMHKPEVSWGCILFARGMQAEMQDQPVRASRAAAHSASRMTLYPRSDARSRQCARCGRATQCAGIAFLRQPPQQWTASEPLQQSFCRRDEQRRLPCGFQDCRRSRKPARRVVPTKGQVAVTCLTLTGQQRVLDFSYAVGSPMKDIQAEF